METTTTSQNESVRQLTFADKFSKLKSKFMIFFWIVFFFVIAFICYPTVLTLYSITETQKNFYTIEVTDSHAQYTRVTTMPATWVPIEKISKRIQGAIISSEDGKFYDHPGYDLEQLRDAINDSFVRKKKMRGASTITQQLIKNLYLSKDKTFGRKIKELGMSLMIEKYADKKKILETYLNIIEYGKGLYGINAATKYYFNKTPAQITAREAAFLAMLLPSPTKYSKSFKNKTLTQFAKGMIDSILLKMRQGGYISEDEYLSELGKKFNWEKAPLATDPVINTSEEEFSDSEEKE